MICGMAPLDSVLAALPILARAGASMQMIEGLGLSLDSHTTTEPVAGPSSALEPVRGPLELRDVSFSYPSEGDGDGFKLGPIRLAISPGETLFIVGGNGSGKTTLLKLVCGLYPPDSGAIHYNGSRINDPERDADRGLSSVGLPYGFPSPPSL